MVDRATLSYKLNHRTQSSLEILKQGKAELNYSEDNTK